VRTRGILQAIRSDKEDLQKSCDTDKGGCGGLNTLVCSISTPLPQLLAITCSWDSGLMDPEDVSAFMREVKTSLQLKQLYKGLEDLPGPTTEYALRSLVCYRSQHYTAYAYDTETRTWMYFDDTIARKVGNWEAVKQGCIKAQHQPVMLIYALA
jgi:hypothetical protein